MMATASQRRPGLWLWLWMAGYSTLMCAIVMSLVFARRWATAELAKPQSVGDWQAWRADVERQAEQPGTVQRRVPKSAEPPALVLLRDHFGVLLTGAVLFSSLLYWVMAWFLVGAYGSASRPLARPRN